MDSDSESFKSSDLSTRIALEIDLRLLVALRDAGAIDVWGEPHAAASLRLAYGVGYQDALLESQPGQLFIDLGLQAPSSADA